MRRRSPWLTVTLLVALLIAAGAVLIATTRNQTGPREIGIALVTGGITGLLFLFVQSLVQEETERQQLLLQLSTTQDLTGLNLRGRRLDRLTVVGKLLPVADLSDATLRNCRFVDVDLQWATLRRSDFSGSTFAHANLDDTDLRDATFERVDLRHATFRNARLSGAVFHVVDLAGAALADAHLDGCIFRQVHHDASTTWPEGFPVPPRDPASRGIHADEPDWHEYWIARGRAS